MVIIFSVVKTGTGQVMNQRLVHGCILFISNILASLLSERLGRRSRHRITRGGLLKFCIVSVLWEALLPRGGPIFLIRGRSCVLKSFNDETTIHFTNLKDKQIVSLFPKPGNPVPPHLPSIPSHPKSGLLQTPKG